MATLYVIMTGLMVLVEPNQGGALVLLRRVEGEQVGGNPVRPHTPQLLFRRKDAPSRERLILSGEDVEFMPVEQGTVVVNDQNSLLRLGELAGENLRVKGGCVGGNPGQDCVIESQNQQRQLLAGRIRLSGGSISALQLDELPLTRVSLEIATQLVGALSFDDASNTVMAPRPIANGMLYQRNVGAGPVSLVVGGQAIELEPLAPDRLGNLPAPEGDQGFVVWVVNAADQQEVMQPEVFDDDFALLYDFVDGAASRVVPKLMPVRIHGPGTPPDKCMPATVPGPTVPGP